MLGMHRNKLTLAELLGPAPSSFGNALGSISPLRLDGRGACILRPQTLLVGRSCAGTREENGFLHSCLGVWAGQGGDKEGFRFLDTKLLQQLGQAERSSSVTGHSGGHINCAPRPLNDQPQA